MTRIPCGIFDARGRLARFPCGILDARGRLARFLCGILDARGRASKNGDRFLRRRVACTKKKWIFSAPQGCMYKNNDFFLRRRVACTKIMDFFCARGSSVKKQRVFSAPEGQASKNNEFFLHLGRKSALVNAYLIRSRGKTGFARGGMGVSPRSFRQKWTMFRRFRTPVCRISP